MERRQQSSPRTALAVSSIVDPSSAGEMEETEQVRDSCRVTVGGKDRSRSPLEKKGKLSQEAIPQRVGKRSATPVAGRVGSSMRTEEEEMSQTF